MNGSSRSSIVGVLLLTVFVSAVCIASYAIVRENVIHTVAHSGNVPAAARRRSARFRVADESDHGIYKNPIPITPPPTKPAGAAASVRDKDDHEYDEYEEYDENHENHENQAEVGKEVSKQDVQQQQQEVAQIKTDSLNPNRWPDDAVRYKFTLKSRNTRAAAPSGRVAKSADSNTQQQQQQQRGNGQKNGQTEEEAEAAFDTPVLVVPGWKELTLFRNDMTKALPESDTRISSGPLGFCSFSPTALTAHTTAVFISNSIHRRIAQAAFQIYCSNSGNENQGAELAEAQGAPPLTDMEAEALMTTHIFTPAWKYFCRCFHRNRQPVFVDPANHTIHQVVRGHTLGFEQFHKQHQW